jgi:hypothetical protein
MSNQIDQDKEWLNALASGVFKCLGHDINDKLRDIASRLGKLPWVINDHSKTTDGRWFKWVTPKRIMAILESDIEASFPDEPKPETSAQKYERITGEKAYYWSKLLGEEMPKLDYIAWLEADKPDDWPRRK